MGSITGLDFPLILCLIGAAAAGATIHSRRIVYLLGRHGPALSPAFLLIVWYCFLWLGEYSGSLLGMGLSAALALSAMAVLAVKTSRKRRLRPARWSWLDRAVYLFISFCLFALPLYDIVTHVSLLATVRRGNVPPCAYNDPAFPMVYHALYTTSGAYLSKAFAFSADLSLHLAAVILLFGIVCALQAVSRLLFKGEESAQAARVFFLLGYGPVYFNPRKLDDLEDIWAGLSGSPFVEAISRPPQILNFLILLFLLGVLLPRLPASDDAPRETAPDPLLLLPALLILPQASEELTCLTALFLIGLAAARRLTPAWTGLSLALMLVSACAGGVFKAYLGGKAPMTVPQILFAWPPLMISWSGNAPLLSWKGLSTIFYEWGPILFSALAPAWRDRRRRVCVLAFAVCFLVASLFRTGDVWNAPDFDRFLFVGTALGFLVTAVWIERIEQARLAGRLSPLRSQLLSGALYAFVIVGQLGCMGFRLAGSSVGLRAFIEQFHAPVSGLDASLRAVGPQDQILTDSKMVGPLIEHGYIVVAPMAKYSAVGAADMGAFDDYVRDFHGRPSWYFLPEKDPRVSDRAIQGAYKSYILVKAG